MDLGSTPMSLVSSSMTALSEGHHAVYRLCFPNGKGYIGVTTNLTRRLKEHRRADTLVGRATRKYGAPKLQVLAVCLEEYAYDLERKAVRGFDTRVPHGYNLVNGGIGGPSGREISAETRRKLSDARTGIKMGPPSEETRQKLAAGQRGKQHSLETREKISESKLGVSLGLKSDAHKRKISESLKRAYTRRKALTLP